MLWYNFVQSNLNQFDSKITSIIYSLLLFSTILFVEWHIFGSSSDYSNDDVCRFRCYITWSSQLFEVGQPYLLSALRFGGICWRHLRRESRCSGVWRGSLLSLPLSQKIPRGDNNVGRPILEWRYRFMPDCVHLPCHFLYRP